MAFGLICIGMAFLASQFAGVLQAAISIFGIVGGPLIGVYTMGYMFPFVNSWVRMTEADLLHKFADLTNSARELTEI